MMSVVILLVTLSVVQYGCIAKKAPCFEAQAELETRLLAEPFLVGWEKPRCYTDGSYLGMQFGGAMAYCVTESGQQIESYMVNRWETGPDMNCQCARDQHSYRKTFRIGKMFHCAPNGNYGPYGCTGSVCYCQDKYGKQIGTTTVHIVDADSLYC